MLSTFAELRTVCEQRDEQLRVTFALFAYVHGASFVARVSPNKKKAQMQNVLVSPTQKQSSDGVTQCFCAEAGLDCTVSQATGG